MSDDETIQGERTETREDAVRRYGSYWRVSGSQVNEVLGQSVVVESKVEFPFGEQEAAVAKAREMREAKARRDQFEADLILGNRGNRVRIWLADRNLHKRAQFIRERTAKLRTETDDARKVLDGIDAWEPEFVRLPDILRLPVPIEVGAPIWEVGFEWPVEHGIKLRECRVSVIRVYGGWRRNGYDAAITYHCERITHDPGTPAGEPSFDYNFDDLSNPVIPCTTHRGSRLFLERTAAEAHLREVAESVQEKMRESIAAYCQPSA